MPTGEVAEAASGSESTIIVEWPSPEPRLALLDLESEGPGVVAVALGDTEVDRLDLEAGRRRVRVDLPADRQQPGRNLLRVSVASRAATEEAAETPPLPRLRDVFVGVADMAPALELIEEDVPAVEVMRAGGVPSLHQAGPSTLRYAVRLPEDAVLRFTPRTGSESQGLVRFRVSVEATPDAAREIWSLELDSGAAGEEVSVPLAGDAGDLRLLLL